MQNIGIKTVSYPFDWIVSNLIIKIDIINDNFEKFLDINNYEYIEHGEVNNNIINKYKFNRNFRNTMH